MDRDILVKFNILLKENTNKMIDSTKTVCNSWCNKNKQYSGPKKNQIKTVLDLANKVVTFEELVLYIKSQESRLKDWRNKFRDNKSAAEILIDNISTLKKEIMESFVEDLSEKDKRNLEMKIVKEYLRYLNLQVNISEYKG